MYNIWYFFLQLFAGFIISGRNCYHTADQDSHQWDHVCMAKGVAA